MEKLFNTQHSMARPKKYLIEEEVQELVRDNENVL